MGHMGGLVPHTGLMGGSQGTPFAKSGGRATLKWHGHHPHFFFLFLIFFLLSYFFIFYFEYIYFFVLSFRFSFFFLKKKKNLRLCLHFTSLKSFMFSLYLDGIFFFFYLRLCLHFTSLKSFMFSLYPDGIFKSFG
jgi:hypothetical protein